MSTFRYPIEIADSAGEHFEMLEVWVDTGASYTLVPQTITEKLGHSPSHHRSFRLANENVVELGLCQVPLRIGRETTMVSCVFGDDQSEP